MKNFLTEEHRKIAFQFFKFAVVGTFGFLVDLGFFHIAYDVFDLRDYGKTGNYLSAVFSFPFAVTFTWIGNRLFTFRGNYTGRASAQWARFFITCAFGFVINRGTFALLTAFVPIVFRYPVLGLMAGTGSSMFFNFFASRRVVFR